ncbi:hypothetical protein LCGC14_1819270, partial [marine sediment metagenome]
MTFRGFKDKKTYEAALRKAVSGASESTRQAIRENIGISQEEQTFIRRVLAAPTPQIASEVTLELSAEQQKIQQQQVVQPTTQTEFRTREEIIASEQRSPFIRFVAEDLRGVTRDISGDISRFFAQAGITPIIVKFQEKGDEINTRIENVRIKLQGFLDPTQKEIKDRFERDFSVIEQQQEQINKEVQRFNDKFGGEELEQSKFTEAEAISRSIANRQSLLDEKIRRIEFVTSSQRSEAELNPAAFFTGVISGLATSPLTLAQFGVGAVTRPITTTKEFVQDIRQLPSTLKQTPFSSGGMLVGELAGTFLLSAGISSLLKNGIKLSPTGEVDINFGVFNRANKVFRRIIKKERLLFKDKRASAFAEASQILKKVKKKLPVIDKDFALKEFAKKFRDEKINIIEQAIKTQIKEKGIVTQEEIAEAGQFM